MRNTSRTRGESLKILEEILSIASKNNIEVVAYLSMGFGNPYGDPWNVDIVAKWTDKLVNMGVKILSLSDTIGASEAKTISYLFSNLIPMYPQIEFGAHLHTTPTTWFDKVNAAYNAGCKRFDGAMLGYGGCPMAKDELIGNMPTEMLLKYFEDKEIETFLSKSEFLKAYDKAQKVFLNL